MCFAVDPGERIIAQAAAMPGDYTLTGSDGQCSLPVTLVEGRETDVVLKMPSSGPCQIVTAGNHVAGDPPHPWFGAVAVTLAGPWVPSALMVVRSLDNPPNPPPPPVPGDPDSRGHFYVAGLPPGRYEATITSNGERIGARVFEIGAGSEAETSIEVQPQAAP